MIPRDRAAAMGNEAVEIIERGSYTSPSGAEVDISEELERAVAGTIPYPPTSTVPPPAPGDVATEITVVNRTTLAAARDFVEAGHAPVALNFASATHVGGGFRSGARAQEESLCWSSGLYACLRHQDMYDAHRGRKNPFYSDWVIHSPDVPVFRGDDGSLHEEPYPCSFLTSPAVHSKAVRRYMPEREGEIGDVMKSRINKVLGVAALHGHDTLVLGAWGCGAFGGDGDLIAGLFADALDSTFAGVFERIEFAITERTPGRRRLLQPFADALGVEPT